MGNADNGVGVSECRRRGGVSSQSAGVEDLEQTNRSAFIMQEKLDRVVFSIWLWEPSRYSSSRSCEKPSCEVRSTEFVFIGHMLFGLCKVIFLVTSMKILNEEEGGIEFNGAQLPL